MVKTNLALDQHMGRKVVINRCYGGFSLSKQAHKMYMERTREKSKPRHWYLNTDVKRDDTDLIAVIEELGLDASSGQMARLKIITIPEDVDWDIADYDGVEWVAEKHRTWTGGEDSPSSDNEDSSSLSNSRDLGVDEIPEKP